MDLGYRLLGARGPGLPVHRSALPVRRRPARLLPTLLAGPGRLSGLRLRIPRPPARGSVARAALCGAGRLARPAQRRLAAHARRDGVARRTGARAHGGWQPGVPWGGAAGGPRRGAGLSPCARASFSPGACGALGAFTRRRWRRPHAPLSALPVLARAACSRERLENVLRQVLVL